MLTSRSKVWNFAKKCLSGLIIFAFIAGFNTVYANAQFVVLDRIEVSGFTSIAAVQTAIKTDPQYNNTVQIGTERIVMSYCHMYVSQSFIIKCIYNYYFYIIVQ